MTMQASPPDDAPAGGVPTSPPAARVSRAAIPRPHAAPERPDGPPEGFLTAQLVAGRLARATGRDRILPSTIRAMASRGQLPRPAETKWGRRTLWRVTDIDAWLQVREARHVPPEVVRRLQRRLRTLDEQAHTTGNDAALKEAVRRARRRGLSFQQIADAITVKGGDRHPTREAVRSRFGAYL